MHAGRAALLGANRARSGGATFVRGGTDGNGVVTYNATTPIVNDGVPIAVRVLAPTNASGSGLPHNFLYMLVLEAFPTDSFGDPMADVAVALNLPNKYNVTVIAANLPGQCWYGDDIADPGDQRETYLVSDVVPWVTSTFGTGGENHLLIGFSRSGMGAQDLIFRHPSVFAKAASWDFPSSSMTAYNLFSADIFGNEANFEANYQLSTANVTKWSGPFTGSNRIWIGGYEAFQADIVSYDSLLTSLGMPHTLGAMANIAHEWESGWVEPAVQSLVGFVPPPVAPVNTAVPVISGTAQQGQALTATAGTWTNSPTSFAYQWQTSANGTSGWTNLSGATASTYTIQAGDVGNFLRVQVTATNTGGPSSPASSAATAQVTAGTFSASDNFNRANGPVGSSWLNWNTTHTAPAIVSNQLAFTDAGSSDDTGVVRNDTAGTWTNNQYSEVAAPSAFTGNAVGPSVRCQGTAAGYPNAALAQYTAIWLGTTGIGLFRTSNGNTFTQLGSTFSTTVAAGDKLRLTAVGSTLTVSLNGTTIITQTDASITGGVPGILGNGACACDNWVGGNT